MSKKKVAIVFIGTNKYADFFPKWKESVDKHFLNDCEKTILAFSDEEKDYFLKDDVLLLKVPSVTWPLASLFRYKFVNDFLKTHDTADSFDYIFYLDSDLFPYSTVTLKDIVNENKDLVGVHHPGNHQDPLWHTLESNESSNAFVANGLVAYGPEAVYHQGCLWGGTLERVTEMITTLDERIDDDISRGVMAVWYDESHMNWYFLNHLDEVNTLPFNFAFPENGSWSKDYPHIDIKLLHIDKSDDEYPRPPHHAGVGTK